MNLPLLSLRNTGRNRTRTVLTVLGVMVAVIAFGFLRTAIGAYYLGIEAASEDRLVTRNKVSIVSVMPIAGRARIQQVPGVKVATPGVWFNAYYKEEKNFFANFGVEAETFLDVFPEILISPEERAAWMADRTGVLVGAKLARTFGWKVGDHVTLTGTTYPGDWPFTIRGIYKGRDRVTDLTWFCFHWKGVEEALPPEERGNAQWYWIGLASPRDGDRVAGAIDAIFKGSPHETLTESEKAFQMSFLGMVSAIINALQVVSVFVLLIIALILGNTIAMSVRERGGEVAVLKALGFRGGRIAIVIALESAVVGLVGGALGVLLGKPFIAAVGDIIVENVGNLFPAFALDRPTMAAMIAFSAVVGLFAALAPAVRAARLPVAAALRQV